MSFFDDIKKMHQHFGIEGPPYPRSLSLEEFEFRVMAMEEELIEFTEAGSLEEEIDALIDLIVFAMGTLERMGVKMEPHWNAVMAANMAKELCSTAEESKRGFHLDLKKPKGWMPPNHTRILEEEY